MKTKLTESVKQAIVNSGLRSGMTISFHHHLRNGDYVLNMVLEAIAELGIGAKIKTCGFVTKALPMLKSSFQRVLKIPVFEKPSVE